MKPIKGGAVSLIIIASLVALVALIGAVVVWPGLFGLVGLLVVVGFFWMAGGDS